MSATSTVGPQRKPALWKTKWFSVDAEEHGMARVSDVPRPSVDSVNFYTAGPAVETLVACPQQQTGARRGSFLFRDDGGDQSANGITGSSSVARLPSISANTLHDMHFEEQLIVTPFAQILHRLQTARSNYSQMTNVSCANSKRSHNAMETDTNSRLLNHVVFPDDVTKELAVEILSDLDWCLDQLEGMQTYRSVSNLTTNKFKRLLDRELSQLAVSSKSGSQISEYIHSTFLETDVDADAESTAQRTDTGDDAIGSHDIEGIQATSMMSRISGVRQSRSSSSSSVSKLDYVPPTYGVDDVPDSILAEPMSALDQWGIDIFSLESISNGHSLVAVTYTVLKEHDMLTKFQLSAGTLLNYLCRVEGHYRSVPYHNSIHAADVTQSIHSLLTIPAVERLMGDRRDHSDTTLDCDKADGYSESFTDLEILGVIFAGAVHDVDHPGVTNQYLINTGSELALMYNDESVLENHHLAVAFKLLQDDSCDVFKSMTNKTRQRLRRIVIDLVLATDMSKHMGLLAELKTMVETKKVKGPEALQLDNFTDRMQVLENMIHCADLSNPTKPLELYRQWTDRIMQEFFEQGDMERQQGLDISPMCDRHTATVEKSQVGFIDFIVQPLWETWADLVNPFCADLLDNLEYNRDWYSSRITVSSSSSGSASAHQMASPTSDDCRPVVLEEQPADTAAVQTSSDNSKEEEVRFLSTRHPDGVSSTLTLMKTLPRGLSQADDRCPHPEMAVRRASLGSETRRASIGSTETAGTRLNVVSGLSRLRGYTSEVAVNGSLR